MHVDFSLPANSAPGAAPVSLTIGNFDGVHRGHRRLLEATVAKARADAGTAIVITFDPHPRCVLRPDDCPAALTTLDEKADLLGTLGIDRLIVMNFTREVSQWSAVDFTQRLVDGFALRHLVVGHDFALGHKRLGDVAFLGDFGAAHGFDVSIVEALDDEGGAVSSSRVRAALIDGDLNSANMLLGNPYFVDGVVEHGEHVGRTLGFPTANLTITPGKCLPQRGVYTSWARVEDSWHMAATNVGYRPTFGGDRLTVEAYLLDFDAQIYDQRVRLAFVERLREERNYPEIAELVEQMHADVAAARDRLTASGPPVTL